MVRKSVRVYRSANRLVQSSCLSGFGLLIWLGLVACAPTSQSTTGSALAPPTATPTATAAATSAPTPAATATEGASANAWQMFRNRQTGYTVEYPMAWTVDEQADIDGSNVTTFASAGSQASITVIVQAALPDQTEIPPLADMSDTRCEQVTVDRLPATRCFDTVSFSTTTTFATEKNTYTIATSSKHLDQRIYQHFIDSFRVMMWVP